ncbi:MAG: hypothetical protein HYW04_12600, partial [Deltaproteobacteria bacterium]|nr:hypothetical protein [Deltaproteobacteria bacterium]
MDLTEDDVLEILNLIEKSGFDFFQLQTGDLKLVVSKGGYMGSGAAAFANNSAPAAQPAAPQAAEPKKEAPAAEPKRKAQVVRDGTLPINAPMVGTFYI